MGEAIKDFDLNTFKDDPMNVIRDQIRAYPMETITAAFLLGTFAASKKARELALDAIGKYWDNFLEQITEFDLPNRQAT
jgi:hypothetical protein